MDSLPYHLFFWLYIFPYNLRSRRHLLNWSEVFSFPIELQMFSLKTDLIPLERQGEIMIFKLRQYKKIEAESLHAFIHPKTNE